MNSPLRALAQAYVASRMEAMGGTLEGGHALEVGCGGGGGVSIIIDKFGADRVEAIDLDPEMIALARRRLAPEGSRRVHLSVGNVTSLNAEDGTFDAVFDFGAIHLVPAWRDAIAEVARVLKPQGRFFFEAVTSHALRALYPLLTEGFAGMDPPTAKLFLSELEARGINVDRSYIQPRLLAITGWVGDLIGVGRRV